MHVLLSVLNYLLALIQDLIQVVPQQESSAFVLLLDLVQLVDKTVIVLSQYLVLSAIKGLTFQPSRLDLTCSQFHRSWIAGT